MPETKPYPNDLHGLSRILCVALRKMLMDKGEIGLSREPLIRQKNIVAFQGRLRVDALEKFNTRAVFSAVKFYVDAAHLEADQPVGVLIIFAEVEEIGRLLWKMEYPRIDDDDEAAILDGCGTLANLVAGYFVKELGDRGYIHLQMSHFESHINTALNGIAFASGENKKAEMTFWINGEKRLVAELTMTPLPKANEENYVKDSPDR